MYTCMKLTLILKIRVLVLCQRFGFRKQRQALQDADDWGTLMKANHRKTASILGRLMYEEGFACLGGKGNSVFGSADIFAI